MHFRDDPHGNSPLGLGEFRAHCPLCGSPYVCATEPTDPNYTESAAVTVTDKRRLLTPVTFEPRPFVLTVDRSIPGFVCTAGDCHFVGPAARS